MTSVLLLGIGGMGMAPLALYLRGMGYAVYGNDDALTSPVRQLLLNSGIQFLDTINVPIDCVVYSSAISSTHPLYKAAAAAKIPCIRRGEYWAHLIRDKKVVAVIGSHGKTTTTAMLVQALRSSGFPCSYLIGALPNDSQLAPGLYDPQSEWVVTEVDESDGTLAVFEPTLTLAVNFDWDHADYYPNEAALGNVFRSLFLKTHSAVIIPKEDTKLCELAQGLSCNLIRVAINSTPGDKGYCTTTVQHMTASVLGAFNAHNAQMALECALYMQAQLPSEPLKSFQGVARRQDILYTDSQLTVMADYAHHPRELQALLSTLRSAYPGSLHVIFQPHRYTRTQHYYREFAESFGAIDGLILMPVYAASEAPIPSGTTQAIYDALPADLKERTVLAADACSVINALQSSGAIQGLVVFIGAGDIADCAHAYQQILIRQATAFRTLSQQLSTGSVFQEYSSLARKTTLGIGGSARVYIEPKTVQDITSILHCAQQAQVPFFVLGRGSNVLVPDEGFAGIVMRLSQDTFREIRVMDDSTLWVGAGVRLKELAAQACALGWSGFEFMEGIPGVVGGSLRMNAGAMDGWMMDRALTVDYLTLDGIRMTAAKEDLGATYRNCERLRHTVVLGAVLQKAGDDSPANIQARMDAYAAKRKQSQPRESSSGCAFKNPGDHHAGRLIDEAHLKGTQCGDIKVSPVHANFLVNTGHGTSQDVIKLVRTIRNHILDTKGIALEPEVVLMGRSWHSVL